MDKHIADADPVCRKTKDDPDHVVTRDLCVICELLQKLVQTAKTCVLSLRNMIVWGCLSQTHGHTVIVT